MLAAGEGSVHLVAMLLTGVDCGKEGGQQQDRQGEGRAGEAESSEKETEREGERGRTSGEEGQNVEPRKNLHHLVPLGLRSEADGCSDRDCSRLVSMGRK